MEYVIDKESPEGHRLLSVSMTSARDGRSADDRIVEWALEETLVASSGDVRQEQLASGVTDDEGAMELIVSLLTRAIDAGTSWDGDHPVEPGGLDTEGWPRVESGNRRAWDHAVTWSLLQPPASRVTEVVQLTSLRVVHRRVELDLDLSDMFSALQIERFGGAVPVLLIANNKMAGLRVTDEDERPLSLLPFVDARSLAIHGAETLVRTRSASGSYDELSRLTHQALTVDSREELAHLEAQIARLTDPDVAHMWRRIADATELVVALIDPSAGEHRVVRVEGVEPVAPLSRVGHLGGRVRIRCKALSANTAYGTQVVIRVVAPRGLSIDHAATSPSPSMYASPSEDLQLLEAVGDEQTEAFAEGRMAVSSGDARVLDITLSTPGLRQWALLVGVLVVASSAAASVSSRGDNKSSVVGVMTAAVAALAACALVASDVSDAVAAHRVRVPQTAQRWLSLVGSVGSAFVIAGAIVGLALGSSWSGSSAALVAATILLRFVSEALALQKRAYSVRSSMRRRALDDANTT